MPQVAIYAIARNESNNVYQWYECAREADGIFVLDTGSEDNTVALLKDVHYEGCASIQVFTANFIPFRFDMARNFILEQIPEEYEWAVFLDMDEVLEVGWCEKLKRCIQKAPKANALNTRMVYTRDTNNKPLITYNRLMCHKTKEYTWKYPVHEILVAKDSTKECIDVYTDITVSHYPDLSKSRGSYLDLLLLGVKEYPEDSRTWQYLGREYHALREYDKCIEALEKHFLYEKNDWLKAETCKMIADCHEQKGDTKEARDWHILGCSLAPDIRESWASAAAFFYRVGRYYSCLGMIENMMDVQEAPTHTIIRNDSYYREWPYHMLAVCFYAIGNKELAAQHIRRAANMNPTDTKIANDLIVICDIPINVGSDSAQSEQDENTG